MLCESETISEVANAYADDEQDGYVVGSSRCRDWAPRAVQCVHRGRPNRVQDLSNIHTFLSNVARRNAKTLGNGGQYLSPSTLIIILEWGIEEGGARAAEEIKEFYPPAVSVTLLKNFEILPTHRLCLAIDKETRTLMCSRMPPSV